MNDFLKRISSRKFLNTVAVEVAGLVALFAPEHGDTVMAAAVKIAALIAMALAAAGYAVAQGKVDAETEVNARLGK